MLKQLNEAAVELRRWIVFLLAAALFSALPGCGGGSTFNVQNPVAPASSSPTISFQAPPPGSMLINTTASLSAVVNNDPSSSGVDWSLTCPNTGNCGGLTSVHTASGGTVTYTPPLVLAGNSAPVTIVAYATANRTVNVVAPITVTAFGSTLQGTYVLQAQGVDTSLGPYQHAGVIVLDGNGGVTSIEQTANFFDQNTGSPVSKTDTVLANAGSYFVGSDGRGTITVNTNDLDVGVNGIETFSLVSLSSSQALIAQADAAESATGTMDLQTSTATPSGGYAFVVNGDDFNSGVPTAFGGVFNIDSSNTISGQGSIADQNLAGTMTAYQSLSGTLSNPDFFGAVTLNLTFPGFQSTNTFQFTGYIVDATHIKLIESDNGSSTGLGSTGGLAIGQGSATGTFTNDSALSGTYVFGIVGVDLYGTAPNTLTWAGVLTADGSGNLQNGFMDEFLQLNGAQGNAGSDISVSFDGPYSVDIKGTGRVSLPALAHLSPYPNPPIGPKLVFYLTGNGNPALVLNAGDIDTSLAYPSVGTGVAYLQSATPFTLSGDYGFIMTQQNGSENDDSGVMTANSTAGTLSGSIDANVSFNPTGANSMTGTFGTPTSNGRFSGTFSSAIFDFSPFTMEYYPIDSNHGFFLETDLVNPPGPTGVVSFGYYAARAPVCAGCQIERRRLPGQ